MDFAAMTTIATPLSTPASSPCGTKYFTYSSIFFANFKEQQDKYKIQQEQEQQLQQQQRIRTNTRLCRETAINNNNTNISINSTNSITADINNGNEQQLNTTLLASNNTAKAKQSLQHTAADGEQYDNEEMDIEQEEALSVNGTFYAGVQPNKIRITENPLPESINC